MAIALILAAAPAEPAGADADAGQARHGVPLARVGVPSPDEAEPRMSFDIDDPPDTTLFLTPYVSLGMALELDFSFDKNFDLDNGEDDDLSSVEPQADLAFSFDPNANFRAFVNLELNRRILIEEHLDSGPPPTRLLVDEAYVTLREILGGLSLQLGRQDFEDERQWLYDENLDAVRLYYRWDSLGFELSASRQELFQSDLLNRDEEPPINNYFAVGRHALGEDSELNGYVLFRDDRSARRRDRAFIGVQSVGALAADFDYWLDAAYQTGADDQRAFAFDVGGTYRFRKVPGRPALTAGVAFGSGDGDRDDDVDRDFRQTGLQDNEGQYRGVTSFKYYGEVLDPELSNLQIFTLGAGVRPFDDSSVDLVYHYYRQHHSDDTLLSNLDLDPDGGANDLGHGVDLILGYRAIKDLDVELALGAFVPGSAFPEAANPAYRIGFEIRYDF